MLKKNSFSGGTNNTTITTGNSGGSSGDAFSNVDGSPKYTTSQATGSRSPLVASLLSDTGDDLQWNISLAARTLWVRAYVYLSGSPSAESWLIFDSELRVLVQVNTNRTLSMNSGGFTPTTWLTTTTAIPTGQWCRIEAKIVYGTTSSNGSVELRLYTSADSATAAETKTASSINTSGTLPTLVTWSFLWDTPLLLDDIGASDVDWLGPAATSTAVAGTESWSLTEQSSIGLDRTDSGTFSDSSSLTTSGSTTDSGSLTETSGITLPSLDSGTLTDSASIAIGSSSTDSATFTDTASIAVSHTGTDSGTFTDTSSLSPAVSTTDSATFTESTVIDLSSTDSATLDEVSDVDETFGPATGDLGTLSEAASIAVTLATTDSGTTDDTSAVAITKDAVDDATLAELSSIGLAGNDSGTFTDTASIAVALAGSDSATVTDLAVVVQPVTASDSATLTESSSFALLEGDATSASQPYVLWSVSAPYINWACTSPYT